MISFENPLALFLVLILPLGYSLRKSGFFQGGRLVFSLGIWQGPAHPSAPLGIRALNRLSAVLWSLGLLLLIVGFANPGLARREEVILESGTTIVFVLDESPTMAAQDLPGKTRFDASREVIERFVKSLRGVQFGLITFAQNAALRVVPTLDRDTFLEKMWALQIADLGYGTALGMGLALGGLYLSELPGNRVLVLLTDGQNNAGEIRPETAARSLRGLGVKTYIVGIGSRERVPAVLRDPATGRILAGTLEESFNEAELKSLAGLSGGSYFTAQSPGLLEAILRSIQSREITGVKTSVRVRFESFQGLVAQIGALLLIGWLLVRKILLREVL